MSGSETPAILPDYVKSANFQISRAASVKSYFASSEHFQPYFWRVPKRAESHVLLRSSKVMNLARFLIIPQYLFRLWFFQLC